MQSWKPIEEHDFSKPIWVLKYDMYEDPDPTKNRACCSKDTPGAIKWTSCHGWYKTEEDALTAQRHFPNPEAYHCEKVYMCVLKDA